MTERKLRTRHYSHWFRMYDEILDDPKIVGLSDQLCWTWVKVLAVARRYEGVLPSYNEMSIVLRIPEKETKSRIQALVKAGLIDKVDGPGGSALTPHSWRELYNNYARPDRWTWWSIKKRIFARDNSTCQYCGARPEKPECDHVLPVSKGGGHEDSNLVTSCRPCNRAKGSKTLAEWMH